MLTYRIIFRFRHNLIMNCILTVVAVLPGVLPKHVSEERQLIGTVHLHHDSRHRRPVCLASPPGAINLKLIRLDDSQLTRVSFLVRHGPIPFGGGESEGEKCCVGGEEVGRAGIPILRLQKQDLTS